MRVDRRLELGVPLGRLWAADLNSHPDLAESGAGQLVESEEPTHVQVAPRARREDVTAGAGAGKTSSLPTPSQYSTTAKLVAQRTVSGATQGADEAESAITATGWRVQSVIGRFRSGLSVRVDPGRDTNVRLSLCLVQRLYLALRFCRPALSSTRSSLKPQEAPTYLVTRAALKVLRPTGMLLLDPKPPACPADLEGYGTAALGARGILRAYR